MSIRTWSTTIGGRAVALKLKKDLAERVSGEIKAALKVPGHWIEITGVIGGEERRSQLWTPFGGAPVTVADPELYAADCAAFLAGLPELITEENAPAVVTASRELFKKHLPVQDLRTTAEEHAAEVEERNAKIQEHEESRAAFIAAQVAKYGDSPETITVPEGYTPIVIELNYNDSDSQSDYFNRHHPHGPAYLLALVKGRPSRTEKLHRDIIAKYPELAALPWTWNTENYSMGHGNWLESSVVGEAEGVETYGGVSSPAVWWEVSTGWDKKYIPFRGYSKPAPTQNATPSPVSDDCAYAVTHEREWTWIKFPCKPAPEVLDTLRSHGARWGHRRSAWYLTRHVEESEVAQWLGVDAEETPKPEHTEILVPAEVWLSGESSPAPIELPSRFALYDDD